MFNILLNLLKVLNGAYVEAIDNFCRNKNESRERKTICLSALSLFQPDDIDGELFLCKQ